jgi:hypothetical protein
VLTAIATMRAAYTELADLPVDALTHRELPKRLLVDPDPESDGEDP